MLNERSGSWITVDDRRGSLREITIVFGLTVGGWLVLWVLKGSFITFDFGQARLLRTFVAEAIYVVVLWPWLARRGWSFGTIAGAPQPIDILRGLGLAIAANIAYFISAYTWIVFVPGTHEIVQKASPVGTAAAWVVMVGVILNPMVEEFLWLGYGITALRRYGTRTAVLASLALRMSVHLYQGRLAFISVLPLAVVFTLYFVRTRRLWPVIVAHMFFDTLGLLSVVRHVQ
jgi:CAAX protease family protein